MQVEVNGTRLWLDVDGPALVPDGQRMRERPTIVLVHGGPGSYDHSYFKPHFGRLAGEAQVVYLDLRGHGRSDWHDPADWSFELCADDLRAFCNSLGIVKPVVLGHSMGGFVAMLYGIRHPGHAGGLILQSTMARFDLARLVEGFRRFGGDEVAELARRDYDGDPVNDEEWTRVFAAFGPTVPSEEELARRIRNPELGTAGLELMRRFDVVDDLRRITSPTLVCVGELDAVTPVAASVEIADALPRDIGRLEVIDGAGHFPWLDAPDRYFSTVKTFVATAGGPSRETAV
ncbi:MAG TPA: alpha/beta hydrolase [Candidatus Limnocylindrales bacterium]|nr:alpha/beta hydrolase [Candidatus Limnocylindrales bacterium]